MLLCYTYIRCYGWLKGAWHSLCCFYDFQWILNYFKIKKKVTKERKKWLRTKYSANQIKLGRAAQFILFFSSFKRLLCLLRVLTHQKARVDSPKAAREGCSSHFFPFETMSHGRRVISNVTEIPTVPDISPVSVLRSYHGWWLHVTLGLVTRTLEKI